MMKNREAMLEDLEAALGYSFRKRELLVEALTHRSLVNEARSPGMRDNQRLEFFGDAVLGFVVSCRLLELLPAGSEGRLSRIRASLVDAETLAGLAGRIDLGRYLLLGRGEEKSGGRGKKSVLADALESLVAAVYLDGGIAAAERAVDGLFGDLLSAEGIEDSGRDYKTRLQELSHSLFGSPPLYSIKEVFGPDHDRRFTVEVAVRGEFLGRGTGRSKKEAEQAAARFALENIDSAKEADTL